MGVWCGGVVGLICFEGALGALGASRLQNIKYDIVFLSFGNTIGLEWPSSYQSSQTRNF